MLGARPSGRAAAVAVFCACLTLFLVRAEASWGTVAGSSGISVPRGSFSDTTVGLVVTTTDTTGAVFRVTPSAAPSTECPLYRSGEYDFTSSGVSFRITRVDGGVKDLPFRLDFELNSTVANKGALQTFVPFGHGLYACRDGKWHAAHTLYCTSPVSPSITAHTYLQASTCQVNLSMAVLHDTCRDDIPYAQRGTYRPTFLRSCHYCAPAALGYDFRGCDCEVNSTDNFDTDGLVISMAVLSAVAFLLASLFRARLLMYNSETDLWMTCVFYLLTGAFIIARLFGTYDGRNTTQLSATSFTTIRAFAAFWMVVLLPLQVSRRVRELFLPRIFKNDGNDSSSTKGWYLLVIVMLFAFMLAANATLLLAPAFPAFMAHRREKSYPSMWSVFTGISLAYLIVQEWATWAWVHSEVKLWSWRSHHFLWMVYALLAMATAVLWGIVSSLLPCE